MTILMQILLLAPVLLMPAAPAQAATLVVNSLADNGPGNCTTTCTLRDAIAVAAAADTITFSVTGAIVLTRGPLSVSKSLTIQGPGPAGLAVDGNQIDTVFDVSPGSGVNQVAISGLTVRNAGFTSNLSGGIFVGTGATLTLSNAVVTNNAANNGGGIASQGTLIATNVTISNNTADNAGGGLASLGTTTLTNVVIGGNSTFGGGGISHGAGALTLTNVTLDGNTAQSGGGIQSTGSGSTLILNQVTFSNNVGTAGGGGLDLRSTGTLTNVTFSGNRAT